MTKIGILSDTHSFLDEAVFTHFAQCDEIWHIGDFGDAEVAEKLQAFKPLKGVYGNIDEAGIREAFPLYNSFLCEDVPVLMTHIGGYPPKYNAASKALMKQYRPKLFLSGHSHILKVMYDEAFGCLHINPGAAGKHGWHAVRTLIRIAIDGSIIKNCEIIELGGR
ncbi:metallophosphoesterase family protein [Parasediminibacterium sp. JCM 36343]|uniref:metallophosphoesterase family protein n=1 Tax=Parasediminibacterium sp. JCM 36343 TaxID=3374279 RepID=UPI00397DFD50